MLRPQPVQYDLFGEIDAAETSAAALAQSRSTAATDFLTQTPWPDLLGWWAHPDSIEAKLTHGETKAYFRRCPDGTGWAWAIWRDGLRFEPADAWQGWSHRPQWCIPWQQLRALRATHHQITDQVALLAAGRGHPTSAGWRWWTDPHALNPHGMHPSALHAEQCPDWYPNCDRPATAYGDRIEAWRLVLEVVRAAALEVHDTSQ